MIRFSSDVLNNFIASDLSTLLAPILPDVPDVENQSIVFTMNYVLGSLKFKGTSVAQAVMSAMQHNTTAVHAYRSARSSIQEYIADLPNHDKLFAVVQALADFENCILHSHITAQCLNEFQRAMTGKGFLMLSDEVSEYARLRKLSNRIKHFDQDIAKSIRNGLNAPARAIWLTDEAVVCTKGSLLYAELADVLSVHSTFVQQLASDFFKDPSRPPAITVT